jgi:hypothetical protein
MTKRPIQFTGEKIIFLTNSTRTIHKKINEPYLPHTKINLKRYHRPNMQNKTKKPLENEYLCNLREVKDFLSGHERY